jgi:hypothetical protein
VQLLRHLDDDQTKVEGLLAALLRDGAQEKGYDQQKPASRRRVPVRQRTPTVNTSSFQLDGVYRTTDGVPVFHGVRVPTTGELQALLARII